MPPVNRIRSILRYLTKAHPIHSWRLVRMRCPNCEGRWFLSLRPDPFMTRCLRCFANLTNLSLIPVVQRHCAAHAIETAWEMSTYGATLAYLRRHVPQVHTSEYFPGTASGSVVDGITHQDVLNLSFADASLDLITSSQVFEHVADDLQGYRECHRVLKPGGALIFSIPLYDIPTTQQLARVRGELIEHLVSPEYHDSRRGGPGSALCFWRHSFHDIAARVGSTDFAVELVPVAPARTRIEPSYVVYARKPD